jgi:predicted CXXCH cytochrome family protein
MAPVRYDKDCAECHPLAVRIAAETSDSTVREHVQAFCRQPAPHAAPDLVSAVLRERLRLLAQQNPLLWMSDPVSEPLRSMPGRRPEQLVPRDLSGWVDYQTSFLQVLLFDSAGGCRYCHIAKRENKERLALAEYERTNIPVSWFPYAQFSHAKHGLMACNECHDTARTSSRTRDVLMPSKQICGQCHSSERRSRGYARADCLECHHYHSHGQGDPAWIPTRRLE